MKKPERYMILTETLPGVLEKFEATWWYKMERKVNSAMKDGWKPTGGIVFLDSNVAAQAMVKE
jgi:hypothetical protein